MFFALVLLCACHKEMQPVATRSLEGHWQILSPATPNWHYVFTENLLEQSVYVGPTKVISYQFTYATRRDTLFIGGDITSPPRVWKYKFHLDSLIELTDITPGVMISPVSLIIKR